MQSAYTFIELYLFRLGKGQVTRMNSVCLVIQRAHNSFALLPQDYVNEKLVNLEKTA